MKALIKTSLQGRVDRRNPIVFLGLSLLIHLMVAMGAGVLIKWQPRNIPSVAAVATVKPIEIVIVDKKSEEDPNVRQVVQTQIIQKTDEAEKKAFWGEKTQTVERQTRASVTARFQAAERGGRPQSADAPPRDSEPRIGLRMDYQPMGQMSEDQKQARLAATSDYLKDVALGAQTVLNTREYAYYSFYSRIRTQLEQYWEPGLKKRIELMLRRGRHLAAEREHSTRLVVVMNDGGEITKIQIEDTSGLMDLDQAAIDAFNRAGPFPNPPHGMIDPDGTVRVEWEFVLKT